MLTLLAFGWAVAASAVCFFYGGAFWLDSLGRFGAFWGALVAFVVSIVGARLILKLADKLLEPYSGPYDRSVYAASPKDTFHYNWQRYADEIVRNRRFAFYMRTRQWDRLAALEVEAARANVAGAPGAALSTLDLERQRLIPQRTSMAGVLPPEEVSRAARRGTFSLPRTATVDHWAFLDEPDAAEVL